MRTFRIQSHISCLSLSLYHGELLSAKIMAGLLARDSSSRRLPGLPTSDIMPFVLAYSGGSAGDSRLLAVHPSSLSSPCGHRNPLFSCHKTAVQTTRLRYHAPHILSRKIVVMIQRSIHLLACFQTAPCLRLSTKPISTDSPRVSTAPTSPEMPVARRLSSEPRSFGGGGAVCRLLPSCFSNE